MTQELDEKLCKKYPKIFANRYGDMRTTCMCWGMDCGDGWYQIIDSLCSNLQWNTDHNNKDYIMKNTLLRKLIPFLIKIAHKIPGTYKLNRGKQQNPLVKLRGFLVSTLSEWRSKQEFIYTESHRYPQIVASQVKEKFGGLRFYVEGATERQYAVISFIESLSYQVCENCGSMKDIGQTQGWISTICKECNDKNPDKYKNWKQYTEKDETEGKNTNIS